MNVHTPERGKDEPFAMYKTRRQLSRIQLRNLIEPVAGRFVQHTADRDRRLSREIIEAGGVRQYKRMHGKGYAIKRAKANIAELAKLPSNMIGQALLQGA